MLACGAPRACYRSDNYCFAACRNLITCCLMFGYMRETFFFCLCSSFKEMYQTKKAQTWDPPQHWPPPPCSAACFWHTKTQWIIIMSAYYLRMAISSWTIHFSPIHNSRMGAQTPYFCSNTTRSIAALFLYAAESLGCVLGWKPESSRDQSQEELGFIYWWSERSSEWENWVTASAQQQLTRRGLKGAAVDCTGLNDMSHNTGATLILCSTTLSPAPQHFAPWKGSVLF